LTTQRSPVGDAARADAGSELGPGVHGAGGSELVELGDADAALAAVDEPTLAHVVVARRLEVGVGILYEDAARAPELQLRHPLRDQPRLVAVAAAALAELGRVGAVNLVEERFEPDLREVRPDHGREPVRNDNLPHVELSQRGERRVQRGNALGATKVETRLVGRQALDDVPAPAVRYRPATKTVHPD